ncbi:hypothetical protein C3488_07475 [Streptomyces sp. Ru72]|nr:hypothetical protein C3488_07475 [Streptomyces sp. Ru72]
MQRTRRQCTPLHHIGLGHLDEVQHLRHLRLPGDVLTSALIRAGDQVGPCAMCRRKPREHACGGAPVGQWCAACASRRVGLDAKAGGAAHAEQRNKPGWFAVQLCAGVEGTVSPGLTYRPWGRSFG